MFVYYPHGLDHKESAAASSSLFIVSILLTMASSTKKSVVLLALMQKKAFRFCVDLLMGKNSLVSGVHLECPPFIGPPGLSM